MGSFPDTDIDPNLFDYPNGTCVSHFLKTVIVTSRLSKDNQ